MKELLLIGLVILGLFGVAASVCAAFLLHAKKCPKCGAAVAPDIPFLGYKAWAVHVFAGEVKCTKCGWRSEDDKEKMLEG